MPLLCIILTWFLFYNKKIIHYFTSKNLTLCNRNIVKYASNGSSKQEINPDQNFQKCKNCLQVLSTYSNLENYKPKKLTL